MQRASPAVVFGACFVSSLLAAPLAALLALLGGAKWPIALAVAVAGTPVGLSIGVVFGFPALVVLARCGLNTPLLGAIVGGLLGAAAASWLNHPQEVRFPALPALFGVGALCGVVASRMCALTTPSSGRPSAAAHVER
jgi:hypothetical protein